MKKLIRFFIHLSVLVAIYSCQNGNSKNTSNILSKKPFLDSNNDNQTIISDPLIDSLLKSKESTFSVFYNNPSVYRMQIIYTEVHHHENDSVSFKEHLYRVNNKEYFNPASLVKFPLMLMAIDKINNLNKKEINLYTRILIEKSGKCQKEASIDTTSPSGFPNFANYFSKILLYSDNDAYNRTYEFLGQKYIEERFKKWGIDDAKVVQRFDRNCESEDNRYTNAFRFLDADSNTIYYQKAQYNNEFKPSSDEIIIGKNEEVKGKLTGKGKNFANSNTLPLKRINDLVIGLFYPKMISYYQHINLTDADRNFLIKYMGLYPRESDYTIISDTVTYHDSYKKYFIYGQKTKYITDNNLRIYNMVGQSYGFLSDIAYIIDFKNKRDFFLSATIYVNSNEIINDGKYDYTKLGLPYLKNLGLLFLEYERKKNPVNDSILDKWKNILNN